MCGDEAQSEGAEIFVFPVPYEKLTPSGSEGKVRRIDPYQFYELGIALRALHTLEGDKKVGGIVGTVLAAQRWLEQLLGDEPLIELRHCRHAAEGLLASVQFIIEQYIVDKKGRLDVEKWDNTIPEYGFYGIRTALETFEHNFAAEMREAAVYAASQVGMYNTGDLVDRTEIHLPAELRECVNESAIFEIKSAGRCLAFGLPTASGFHILRAAESVLEDYYGMVSGKPGATQRGWHDYAEALDKLSDGDDKEAPSKRVIRSVRQIKDLDRNRIMHPRAVLEEADAMILFMVATSAIAQMAMCLRDAGGQTELQLIAPDEDDDKEAAG